MLEGRKDAMEEIAMQEFQVDGMTCGHCVRAVTGAVHGIDPAATVDIDRAAGRARVQSSASAMAIAAAIGAEGYKVTAVPA